MIDQTANLPAIIIAVLAMLIFGIFFAAIVRRMRRRNPQHGQTAWLVVCGNCAIALAFTLLAGIDAGAVLVALMAAAGLPMIAEYVDDHLGNEQRNTLAQIIRITANDATEDDHAL